MFFKIAKNQLVNFKQHLNKLKIEFLLLRLQHMNIFKNITKTLTSMKNILIMCLLSIGVLLSCTDKKATQNNDNQLSTEQLKEVEKLEQENQNLDSIQNEIIKSSKELDELLKEIDN